MFSGQEEGKKVSRSFGLNVSLYKLRHGSGCSFAILLTSTPYTIFAVVNFSLGTVVVNIVRVF